jgi:phytoene/squalene synthetase
VAELFRGEANPAFARLMSRSIARAEDHYSAARVLYSRILPEGRRIFGLMISTYHVILTKIARRPAEVFRRRIGLSRFTRLRFALRWSFWPPPEPEDFTL